MYRLACSCVQILLAPCIRRLSVSQCITIVIVMIRTPHVRQFGFRASEWKWFWWKLVELSVCMCVYWITSSGCANRVGSHGSVSKASYRKPHTIAILSWRFPPAAFCVRARSSLSRVRTLANYTNALGTHSRTHEHTHKNTKRVGTQFVLTNLGAHVAARPAAIISLSRSRDHMCW